MVLCQTSFCATDHKIHTAQTSGVRSVQPPNQRCRTQRNRRISLTRWEVGLKIAGIIQWSTFGQKTPWFFEGILNQHFTGGYDLNGLWLAGGNMFGENPPNNESISERIVPCSERKSANICVTVDTAGHYYTLVFLKYLLRFGVLGMLLGSKCLITWCLEAFG